MKYKQGSLQTTQPNPIRRKAIQWLIMVAVVSSLGFTMPSCPGQQAMQQQIDALQKSNGELNTKIQTLNSQITSLTNDMNQVKQLLPQMTNVIQAQKGAIDQLDSNLKDLQSRVPTKGKKKGAR